MVLPSIIQAMVYLYMYQIDLLLKLYRKPLREVFLSHGWKSNSKPNLTAIGDLPVWGSETFFCVFDKA